MDPSAAPMEPGFYEPEQKDTAETTEHVGADLVQPCAWDNTQPCAECQKTRCSQCAFEDSMCQTCAQRLRRTCVAFCELDPQVCEAQKRIDFTLWQEMYAAVRCLRDRRAPHWNRKSHADHQHRQRYYPGFCRQHNETTYAEWVEAYWRPLPEGHKLLLEFLIDGNTCDARNMDAFFTENMGHFRNFTLYDVMHLLLTPAGIMGVDPLHFQTYLQWIIERQQFQFVTQHPEVMQRFQAPDFLPEEADQWVVRLTEQFREQRHDYRFLVDGVLQPKTLAWLMDENECLRNFHWNMVFYKLAKALVFCFLPVDVRNTIPAFHPNWKGIWIQAAQSVMTQLPNAEAQNLFLYHWSDFLSNMEDVALTIDQIMERVPHPDPRPMVNPWPEVQAMGSCPLNEN